MSKRQFPYYSAVDEFRIQKNSRFANPLDAPGFEKNEPRVFEAHPIGQVRAPAARHQVSLPLCSISTACMSGDPPVRPRWP